MRQCSQSSTLSRPTRKVRTSTQPPPPSPTSTAHHTTTLLSALTLSLSGPLRYLSIEDRSGEIAELQKTVRLLIERGVGGGNNNNAPQSYAASATSPPIVTNLPSTQRAKKPAASFNFTGQAATHSANLSPRSSPAIPSSPPSLSLGNQPDGSTVPPLPLPSSASSPALIPINELFGLQEQIKQLERRNRELHRQLTLTEVSNVVDIEKKYGLSAPGQPAEVRLTPSEVETIRAIFNLFDVDQRGSISVKEIRNLHAKLGEPMNEQESDVAMKELDQDGTGEVNFHQFLYWWFESHKNGKKSTRYTERFKLVHAKLSSEHFNVDRVITQDSGTPYTLEYRLNFYYKQPNSALRQISPWHDVPLYKVGHGAEGQIYNMVCEIPRYTRAKFECATGEPFNPIKQDTQHGKLRFYKHGDIMFNYGFFPQTWEDPSYINEQTGYPGDNDPIDVLDIGAKQLRTGEIVAVKILGVLALIDDGETDWKVIAICISDAMAHMLNDIDDVETHLPGTIKAIREYFRMYVYHHHTFLSHTALSYLLLSMDTDVRCCALCTLYEHQLQVVQRQDQHVRTAGPGYAATVRRQRGGGHTQALAITAHRQQAERGHQDRRQQDQARRGRQRGTHRHRASGPDGRRGAGGEDQGAHCAGT